MQRAIGGLLFPPNSHGTSWLRNSYVSVIKKEIKNSPVSEGEWKVRIFSSQQTSSPGGKEEG